MARGTTRAGALALAAWALALLATAGTARAAEEPTHPQSLDDAIIKAAARHGVPESLVRRIVMRESKYNPRARNHKYWGLMQISYPTARSMGFAGSPQELLNPIVNLRYAVPYLANAFIVAGRRQDEAVRLYAGGYYAAAKQRGLLAALRTATSSPLSGVPDEEVAATAAPVAPADQSGGFFGALFGPQQMPRDADTQQAVYAAAQVQPPQPQPAAQLDPAAAPAGAITASDEVALVADANGELQPPRKWRKDGGTTVIARGEQAIDKVAAYEKGADAEPKPSRHHARKTTIFAALDLPPASAQAYAAPAEQDLRLTQADSQAAIAQATSGAPQPADATAAADDTAPAHRKPRRVAHRSRHHEAPDAVQQAAQQAAPNAAPPQQAAAADPQAAPAAAPAPVQSVDASGYPADAGGGAPSAAGDATEPTTPKRKHHAHRTKPHATAVAARDDAKPAPTPAQ